MTSDILKKIIRNSLIVLFPITSLGQGKMAALSASVESVTAHATINSPNFRISIQNIGNETIWTPKKTLLSSYSYPHSFINTIIEKVSSNQTCLENVFADTLEPFRCNVCFFGNSGTDYLNNNMEILPGKTFTIEEPMTCFYFKQGMKYRVRFSLASEKIGVGAQTDWIYFQIPD